MLVGDGVRERVGAKVGGACVGRELVGARVGSDDVEERDGWDEGGNDGDVGVGVDGAAVGSEVVGGVYLQ